ncbi:hypothetical protein [Cupriavidus necator]|uniref:hypothetical protein n=1 Tax=Cupriavidus necator TaxID=106590 RepID=UPI0005B42B8E|nr:hypothetical protein [Cupriavidus necator]
MASVTVHVKLKYEDRVKEIAAIEAAEEGTELVIRADDERVVARFSRGQVEHWWTEPGAE